jgi:phosphoglycerate dehydrogenase-like enzyme
MADPLHVLIDRDVHPRELFTETLDRTVELDIAGDLDEDELIEALDGVDVLVTTSRLSVTRRVLSATGLSMVAKVGTGIDNVDLEAAAEAGTTVVYTPGLNALSVAEHAVTLLLAVRRNLRPGRLALENGRWRDEVPSATPVTDTTCGLVGFGNIGRRVARLLRGFDADVLAYDPYVHEVDTDLTGAELVDFGPLLESADSLVLATELTEETRGMIDRAALERLDSNAVLVNVTRGPVVDTDALIDALERGGIAGAGLDVFEEEPLPADSPLLSFEQVVATPHIGGSSIRARSSIVGTIAGLVDDYVEGGTIPERFLAARPGEVRVSPPGE